MTPTYTEEGREKRWPDRLRVSRVTPDTRPYVLEGDEDERVEAHGVEVRTYVPQERLAEVEAALNDLIERSDYYLCQTTDQVIPGDERAVSPDRRSLADTNLRNSLHEARAALQAARKDPR